MVVICTIASVFAAHAQYTAQLEEKTLPVGEFNSINVTDNFEVTLAKGAYNAKITADKVLSPYVQVYVRSKTLYVTYDEKAVPKDVKKLFKGRGAPKAIFRATVYVPEISGITLTDNSSLIATDEFVGNTVEISLADNAQIKTLPITAASITLNMKKNSQVSLNVNVDNKLEFYTEGNSNLKVIGNAKEMVCSASGNSSVTLSGDCETSTINGAGGAKISYSQKANKVILQMEGNSNLSIIGESPSMMIKAERNSKIDANGFEVKTLEADMSGSSKAEVTVEELIDATLVGGSSLYFTGTPAIKIGKIVKSTLAPLGANNK